MSLRGYIRAKMPEPMEHCARKKRMFGELVERIYGMVPTQMRNKHHYRSAFSKIGNIFFFFNERNTAIYNLIDMTGVDSDDMKKWYDLEEDIRNYIKQCE